MNEINLRTLFFKYAVDREIAAKDRRFVYYTRADTLLKILGNRTIWLRSASLMNDASEIQHGMLCMEHALQSGGEDRLIAILDRAHAGLAQASILELRKAAAAMFSATYICCVSEHLGEREDHLGRLSMWRAYGGSTGVAMVIHPTAMFSESNAYSTYTSPVLYEDPEGFRKQFALVLDRLEEHIDLIAGQPREVIAHFLYEMLHFSVLSTKHPAFSEELEWRIIHAPYHEANDRMKHSVEVIGGVPQLVYKLPLVNVPDEGLRGMEFAESLDRVIIGPCNHPIETSFALHEAMLVCGIEKPYDRMALSFVPLRVNN